MPEETLEWKCIMAYISLKIQLITTNAQVELVVYMGRHFGGI